jgi:RNA polymerase sigma-70 factor (ECF subfamily)
MTSSPGTRYSLLLRIQDPQNQAAWGEFLSVYEPLVYRLARRRGLQDADAQDLCQEVFRAVAKAAHKWVPDPARGSFRGWLFRIAQNLLVNHLRRMRRHVQASGDTDIVQVLEAQSDETDEYWREVDEEYRRSLFGIAAQAIEGEFTRTTWQAFWRTAVDAQPVAMVAKELSLTAGAVYIARSRVLARLRAKVEELGGEG